MLYTSTDRIECPVWSPDGSRIAWIASRSAIPTTGIDWISLNSKKVASVSPPPHLTFAGSHREATSLGWLRDNRSLLTMYYKPQSTRAQIGMVTIPSGEFHTVTNDTNAYSQLALAADGRTLATVLTNADSSIAYYKPAGGAPISSTPLRILPTAIAWADEEHLLFIVRGVSLGTIDRASGKTHTFDVGTIGVGAWLNACADGHVLFTGFAKGGGGARLFRMNADGGEISQITTAGIVRAPYCSPDSKQIYFTVANGAQASLWVVPLIGGTPKQVLPSKVSHAVAVSHDGRLAVMQVTQVQRFTLSLTDLESQRSWPEMPLEISVRGNHPPRFRAMIARWRMRFFATVVTPCYLSL